MACAEGEARLDANGNDAFRDAAPIVRAIKKEPSRPHRREPELALPDPILVRQGSGNDGVTHQPRKQIGVWRDSIERFDGRKGTERVFSDQHSLRPGWCKFEHRSDVGSAFLRYGDGSFPERGRCHSDHRYSAPGSNSSIAGPS